MKSFFFKYGLGSIIFLILVFTAFVFIQPAYEALNAEFELVKQDIVVSIEKNFGVSLRYRSLSPSIISAFFIQDIEITDTKTTQPVLTVGSIFLKYNFPHLVQSIMSDKPIGDAFSELVVADVSVVFSQNNNDHIVRSLSAFLDTQTVPEDELSVDSAEKEATTIFDGNFFPVLITVKDISLVYTDKRENIFEGFLNTASVTFDEETNHFTVFTDGSISVAIAQENSLGLDRIGLGFSLDGQVLRDFSDISAIFTLDSVGMTDVSISATTFNLALKDSVFSVHAVTELPFTFVYELYTSTGDMNALFIANDFEPSQIVRINSDESLFSSLNDILLSGVFDASYGAEANSLAYSVNATTFLPDSVIRNGLELELDFQGDLDTLTVDTISATSDYLDAEISGDYNFTTNTPYFDVLVHNYTLENGNTLEAEIFVQEQDNGILVFIPQIDFNGQLLTAFELSLLPQENSLDFIFGVTDYTHAEADTPGTISLEGSYLYGEDTFLQSEMTFSNMYADSLANLTAFFLPVQASTSLLANAERLSPYVISNEVYISSDFTSFLFNTPAMIIANTQRDREFLILSFSGNESSINVSQLDMLFAGQSLQATLNLDFAPDYSNLVFATGLTFNQITYNFTGTYYPDSYLGIEGDYGFASYTTFLDDGAMSGSIQTFSLPIRFGEMISAFSFNSQYSIDSTKEWTAQIEQFELIEISNIVSFNPSLRFSGNADKYGLFLDTVTYSDSLSSLEGSGRFNWALFDGNLDNFSADVLLEDFSTSERVEMLLSVTNPEQKSITEISTLDDLYISLESSAKNVRFERFLANQTSNDTLNASLSLLGTLNSPFVSTRIEPSTISLGGIPIDFEGVAQLENGFASISNASVSAVFQKLTGLQAELDLRNFSGKAEGTFDGQILKDSITAPFSLTLTNASGNTGLTDMFSASLLSANIPEIFSVEMHLNNMSGSLAQGVTSGFAQLIRTPGRYDFFLGNNQAFYGYLTDSGYVFVNSSDPVPIQFTASGNIKDREMNISVDNLYADISKIKFILNFPQYTMYEGILQGNIQISGLVSDPEFNGLLNVSEAVLTSPMFVLENVHVEDADFIVEDSVIRALGVHNGYHRGITDNGSILFSLETYFEGWGFEEFRLHLESENDTYLRAQFNALAFGNFEADAICNFDLSIKLGEISFTGDIFLENAEASISFDKFEEATESNNTNAIIDLNLLLGRRVNLFAYFADNLILRGVANPQTRLKVSADTASSVFDFTGTMVLRGGDFIYLSRNFYIREGNLVFNLNQSNLDPVITFFAETRAQDDEGEDVRILLSVENQLFSSIVPRITSIPSKSENELSALLGQVLVTGSGDDDNTVVGTVATVLDYGAQTTLFRNIENQLRKVLNFDIFSLRLPILQNAVLSTVENEDNETNDITIGNFFDNTTVYAGKYFGNALFADALLNLRYDESKINDDSSVGGLVFEPEIGFEMVAPFANIRWSIAPDISETSNNLWIPYTSISLSWKFSL